MTVSEKSVSNYSHPKCYARIYNDCSNKISKEHFISATLLRQIQLNNTVKIAGLKWQQKENFSIVPLSGLASNILCEKHNNSLSPLDKSIGDFTEAIRDYDNALLSKTNIQSEERCFSGVNIELWMLKCLLGLTASKNIQGNLKSNCFDLLFNNITWPEGWGLYFSSTLNSPIYHSNSFLIETYTNSTKELILAAKFVIRGIPIKLCLGKPDNPTSYDSFRPDALVLNAGVYSKKLQLKWNHATTNNSVHLNFIGSHSGPPPDWSEWERNG